ncbi:MAG: hypothetical protein JXM70_16290, partial [Pirellulales bacterium]|nr:hypothetical protein [Pirellulales bacterium]
VMIMPAHKTIAYSSLKKIKQFYDAGGKVIATGTLPAKSAEFGHDADVQKTVAAMFSQQENGEPKASKNAAGGTAVFLPKPTADTLRKALDDALNMYDVEFEPGKELCYIHKVVDGRDVFFFANVRKQSVEGRVRLRGKWRIVETWNPDTGQIAKLPHSRVKEGAEDVTEITIQLSPIESVFVVAD